MQILTQDDADDYLENGLKRKKKLEEIKAMAQQFKNAEIDLGFYYEKEVQDLYNFILEDG